MSAILDEIRALDTSRASLRSFGAVVGGVFLAIAAVFAWRAGWDAPAWAEWMAGVAGVLIVLGLVVPRALRWPYVGWMALAVVLGFVMSRVLLTAVFFGIVLPTGLALRLLGKTPLDRGPDASAATYWHAREAPDPDRFERYF